MSLRSVLLAVAVNLVSLSGALSAADVMTFKVRGANPGGAGSYTGEVTLTKLSQATGKVRWVAGAKKEVTEGIVIKTDTLMGTGHGGKALYALAVYELKGKTIRGTWTMASKPEESGVYELKGSDFDGSLSFADGTVGSVTFTPQEEGLYKVVWDLQSGRYEGIGLRMGDALVAASGDVKAGFGIGIYAPKGDDIEGRWATTQSKAPGTEVWSVPSTRAAASAVGDGKTLVFGGDTYQLRENKSAPGQVTSELREYLRKGDTWETYSKMVALRMQHVKVDAAGLAKATLDQVQKEHPNSYVNEVKMDSDAATIFFILVQDNEVEANLFCYQQVEKGIASAQFVLRNKPPYDSQKKFKSEQDKHWDKWLAELSALGANAEQLMIATAGQGILDVEPVSAPKKAESEVSPELMKAIKADMDKCVAIAQQFMTFLQEGETVKAVALMSDTAFTKMTRESFVQNIKKSNTAIGELKNFKPDKNATDFGVRDNVMTFILQADAEYTNARVRETLKFIRNEQGGIELVSYGREIKD